MTPLMDLNKILSKTISKNLTYPIIQKQNTNLFSNRL